MRKLVRRFAWGLGLSGIVVASLAAVHGCGGDDEGTDNGGTGGTKSDAGDDSSQGGTSGASGIGGTSGGGSGGGSAGDAGIDVKPDCELVGASCVTHSDCCTANCDPDTNVCTNPVGECKQAGTACELPTECCTMVCTGGVCGATVCLSDNEPCTADDLCCSGTCGATVDPDAGAVDAAASVCQPLNPECLTSGNACTDHEDCCSAFCSNGRCEASPSFCTQTGDVCSTGAQCCGGVCTIESGAQLGLCAVPDAPGATGCTVAGEVCGDGALGSGGTLPECGGECCSRSCAPYGPTGVLVCQPPSGCRPTGELCRDDGDCCGSSVNPGGGDGSVTCSKADGADVGRCDNGNACRAAGAICRLSTTSCNAETHCCAGNSVTEEDVCQLDLLGIPRCTDVGDCADAGPLEGKECMTSADCCGLPCLPNQDPNGPTFICGSSCVPAGGGCTTDADCCAGIPCVLPPGASEGICGWNPPDSDAGVDGGPPDADTPDGPDCALYGQECTTAADCCNEIPCTNGRCIIPVF